MCVISGVYDYYQPRFAPYEPPSVTTTTVHVPTDEPRYTIAELVQLIEDFKRARDAAKIVDELTGQPDCVDPDKARLEERVAALEKLVQKLEDRWW